MRLRITITLLLVACVTSASAAESVPQRTGEAQSILERIRLYNERHGINGRLDGDAMLERARWGYQQWLAAEHRRVFKGVEDAGWISLGPANGAGRMTAIEPHPVIDGTVLAGAASGGVWRTTDGGASWQPLTDGLADLSVGALAYAPSNPEVVYVGSGEAGLGSFFVPGIGLLRSDDGGESWFLPAPGEVVAEQFFALSVDPRDEDRLLAATDRGLFASADGGVSWELRLADPELEGVTEIVRSSSEPDRLWAALWCFSQCPAGLARVMSSADGGTSWQPSVAGLPEAVFNNPLLNRIALAAAPSDDRVLYAALNTPDYSPQGPGVAVYRSADGGASWTDTSDPGPYMSFQGWYDNVLTVDPENPDVVVAGGVWYVRTEDGGASWTTLDPEAGGDWMGTATLPHVDGHAFAWQDDVLWLGCDGGVWTSSDRGVTWSGRNSGLVTRQFYGLALDPIRRHRLIGGTQDNKTNQRLGPGEDDWRWVLDGDGFDTAVNPLVPDLVYGSVYGTLIFRSLDGGLSWDGIAPSAGDDRRPFATPLTMRRDRPWELFTGSSRVWHTSDAGSSWRPLGTDVPDGSWSSDVVRSVAVTPADDNRLAIAKGSAIYTSTDGGASWREHPTATIVNSVALSPVDPDLAVAALARRPFGEAPLLRSSDGGATWHAVADGLPPFAALAVTWHPSDPALVFAGTDVGLYQSTDGGVSWTVAGDGLPAVSVHAVVIEDAGSRVVGATHGRGIWELALTEPDGTAPVVTLDGPGQVFIGDETTYAATATDADGDQLDLRFVVSDDWGLTAGGTGTGAVEASFAQTFMAGGEYLVAANAVDDTGRAGFESMVVTAFEPGDDCSTPRVIPGAGPFPYTILTENTAATVGPEDPAVPCTAWPTDPDAGRWASIWLEFTPETTGSYVFSTCGSIPDTALSVWTGPACGPYTEVQEACNDDDRLTNCSGRDTDSWLALELAAGTTVRVLVGATDDDELGELRLTVHCPSCDSDFQGSSLLVPAVARTAGTGGTFWSTALQVVNPGSAPAVVETTLLPGPGTPGASQALPVPAGAAVILDDVVGEIVGVDGVGALRVVAPTSIAATTRTATPGETGSYGQGIPAVGLDTVAADGEAVRLFGLSVEPGFRTNLGLVNPSTDPVELLLRFYDGETNKLAEDERSLGPGRWLQLNRVLDSHQIAGEAVLVVIRQRSRNGRFTGYLSVVDERTGDPTFLAEPAIGRVGDPLWIPAAAHTEGVGGADWRTDLSLFNPTAGDLLATVELLGPAGAVAETIIHVPDGWVRSFPDVVSDLFGQTGAGAIRITPSLGLVMAVSRTYATTPGGTYGQAIPGTKESDVLTSGELALLPGLRQDGRFRTNVGFFNPGSRPVDLVLTGHDADGSPLGTTDIRVRAASWQQLNQPLPPGTVYATVATETPDARYVAYASVVDRRTDDPTYVAAVPADD